MTHVEDQAMPDEEHAAAVVEASEIGEDVTVPEGADPVAPIAAEPAAELGDEALPAARDEAELGDEVDSIDDEDDAEADDDSDADDGDEAKAKPTSNKHAQLDEETEIAADYLEELLDIADLDGDIDTYVEGGRPRVSVLTESDVLVGSHGRVLDALQELCRLAVMTETGHRSRLMLDVAGFRDRRRKELEAIGHDAVAEVQETGQSVRLMAMNPYERKIVHDVVAAAGLTSESEGQEPQRRVVVMPAS